MEKTISPWSWSKSNAKSGWIYLDNNATTPICKEVHDEISEFLDTPYANPSSTHALGKKSKCLYLKAKESVAECFGVVPQTLLFTSGGTESVNLLIQGIAQSHNIKNVYTTFIEHHAVYETILASNLNPIFVPVDEQGSLDYSFLEQQDHLERSMFVFSSVNSETGVKTDIERLSILAKKNRVPFVVDAVAQLGKEPIPFYPGVTGYAFSSHKIHGLSGTGCIYVDDTTKIKPLLHGGNQEQRRRPGTENLLGIIAFAKAVTMAHETLPSSTKKMCYLRDLFQKRLMEELPGIVLQNGSNERVCNVTNLSFKGCEAFHLLVYLDRACIAASHATACSSGSLEYSRVLKAMGLPLSRVEGSLRFSFSRKNTEEEVLEASRRIIKIIQQIRR